MTDPKVRREIALRAAQLMYTREVSEYFTAKRKAARMLGGADHVRDLPSNREIREQILTLAQLAEGDRRFSELKAMRVEALRFLRLLSPWKPKLIGSVLTGHIRSGSDIDLHVFCDQPETIAELLRAEGYPCDVERKKVRKHGEERVFTHIHIDPAVVGYGIELTVYDRGKVNYPFKSSITGKEMERADEAELVELFRREDPDFDPDLELAAAEVGDLDRYEVYESLLRPLEKVEQNPTYHPEGDALFHSLQVFELARRAREYDQELLLAALLHDVGKGIDPPDHVAAGLEALEGVISERTAWLIEHHMIAHEVRAGTVGFKARRRLMAHPDFDDLMLLQECDEGGRVPGLRVGLSDGGQVPSLSEALEVIRALDE
jgi:predicted nucleotidyltransferase